jgi:DNA replication protein DnaC
MSSQSPTPTPTTTTRPAAELHSQLRTLGLWRTAEDLDDLVARATKSRYSPVQLLSEVARLEIEERARKSVERRVKRSRVGRFKPMADYDWEWPKKIDRKAVERVLSLAFLERAENVILVANQGLGKTMIAKNLVHRAVLAGAHALFVTASDLLLDLAKQETPRALERRLRRYAQPSLLAIDELGYLSYDSHAADLLFQIVNRRYEHRSVVLTTNLSFSEWNTVFPNATCATALVERLTHHAEIVSVEGESYRKREAEIAKKARGNGKKGS